MNFLRLKRGNIYIYIYIYQLTFCRVVGTLTAKQINIEGRGEAQNISVQGQICCGSAYLQSLTLCLE